MTIGERLEEARKRQGISIREAAEATKIRGDYLLAMEDNSMNISLPEIYRRGFLKNYARFLKIDDAKILNDYEAREHGRAAQMHGAGHAHGGHQNASHPPMNPGRGDTATAPAPDNRSSFGRMELPSAGGGEEDSPVPTPTETPESRRREPPRTPSLSLQDNTLYLKIAAGVAAFAVLVVLVILLVGLLRGSDDSDSPSTAGTPANPTTQTATAGGGDEETAGQAQPTGPETLTFRIKENVTLIIEQVDPPERLYSGTVQAGEVVSVERTGPITVRFTNGTGFEIERADGQIIRPNSPSIGRIVVRQ